MGFIRQQEERWAQRLLEWQHEKRRIPLPSRAALQRQARDLVDDAHRIARDRGSNVWGIIKEMAGEVIKDRK